MTPEIVARAEWLTARETLLTREKELTRARDALAAQRRSLPMVEITKEYVFEGPTGAAGPSNTAGRVGLAALFEGRRQLIVHHFMWRDDTDDGCPTCSLLIDDMGDPVHLHGCDTTLVSVSRAPLSSIERFRRRM